MVSNKAKLSALGGQRLVASPAVAASSLHTLRDRLYHLYVLPFLLVYTAWTYLYLFQYDRWFGARDYTFLSLVLLVTLNALTFLAGQWSVTAKAFLTASKESDPHKAKMIRIVAAEHQGTSALCKLEQQDNVEGYDSPLIYFTHEKQKFLYNRDRKQFEELRYPSSEAHPLRHFHTHDGHTTDNLLRAHATLYGANKFEVPVPTFVELMKQHMVAPFFVFQLFCVGLWCMDEYWYYSIFTLVMLLMFESTVVSQRLRTLREFRTMSQQPFSMYVYRHAQWQQLSSEELLPGDVVSVVRAKDDNMTVPCDMVIIDGSCIVNEAMLSGESTPLQKESIALRNLDDVYDIDGVDKIHTLYGGTKVLQVTSPDSEARLQAPDGGCIAYVLRTGFGTSQGKLVRMMIFSSEHVSANNMESFMFILFLLMFAVAAAGYVWDHGVKYNNRPRSKLILDCILIITSVVPPELPMELSMAVNTSLLALSRLAIFCTEPFRIPFAGKLDICCFDKTGTITGEDLVVEGIAGVGNNLMKLQDPKKVPAKTTLTLACAHALVKLEDSGVIGDPMEKTTLEAVKYELVNTDEVRAVDAPKGSLVRIHRRFQFFSSLKRMSTVSSVGNSNSEWFVAVKGAPETLQTMFAPSTAPKQKEYEDTYKYYARKGSRVLALGWKTINRPMDSHDLKELEREEVECDLIFAGFLVFHCPLKPDSAAAIKELAASSHRNVMITGDNALTACHVAKEVEIVTRPCLILDDREDRGGLSWLSVDETKEVPFAEAVRSPTLDMTPFAGFDLCVTGKALSEIADRPWIAQLLPQVFVWARVSPVQKEFIITTMKSSGYTTLMCGDGTNDVGALKQSHIGVALLDGTVEDLAKIAEHHRYMRMKQMYEKQIELMARFNKPPPPMPPMLRRMEEERAAKRGEKLAVAAEAPKPDLQNMTPQQRRQLAAQQKQEEMAAKLMNTLGDMEEEVPTLKLGDASIAAPFTSKLSSLTSVTNIIKQGRCTLVTTIQMYKILALNSLISAYSMSVLYLEGMKWGDWQMTIQGFMIALCFFFISRGQPLDKLSKARPQPNIFNFYILLSVIGQFVIHSASLVYITTTAKEYTGELEVDYDGKKTFEPNVLNAGVYLLSTSMQVSTFAINYQGRPFRESLRENSALFKGLAAVGLMSFVAALELSPELNNWLQLIELPENFGTTLTLVMAADFAGAWAVEAVTKRMFSDAKPRPELAPRP
ncbi:putative cation-transporting ATPase 1 [Sorochytrium milnesiophthora]